jgi:hypothetical protein
VKVGHQGGGPRLTLATPAPLLAFSGLAVVLISLRLGASAAAAHRPKWVISGVADDCADESAAGLISVRRTAAVNAVFAFARTRPGPPQIHPGTPLPAVATSSCWDQALTSARPRRVDRGGHHWGSPWFVPSLSVVIARVIGLLRRRAVEPHRCSSSASSSSPSASRCRRAPQARATHQDERPPRRRTARCQRHRDRGRPPADRGHNADLMSRARRSPGRDLPRPHGRAPGPTAQVFSEPKP